MIVRSGFCVLVAFLLTVAACGPVARTAARDIPAPQLVAASGDLLTVNVIELFCQTCAEQIQAGCRAITGVTSVHIDRHEKLISLQFDPNVTTADDEGGFAFGDVAPGVYAVTVYAAGRRLQKDVEVKGGKVTVNVE